MLEIIAIHALSARFGLVAPEVEVVDQVDLGPDFLGLYFLGTRKLQLKRSSKRIVRTAVHEWAHYLQWVSKQDWPVKVSEAEKARYSEMARDNGRRIPGKHLLTGQCITSGHSF